MSVELLDNPRFHGFRVRRQVEGKTFQEYFSLKENGKRLRGAKRAAVKEQAEKRDAELSKLQAKAKDKADKEIQLDDSGQVKGVLCRLKKEKSGTMTPVFQVGIMSRETGKIVNTTVSINKHGIETAWQSAVDFYCHHKQISKRSKIYKDLVAMCPKKARVTKLLKALA
ncbi:MAG: hypothetical protein GKR90_21515 [Pseudomonadales bacterium]|nr:hypothetical protein [Pseudomonadales bacterium]